jgi:hypothetical protein
MSRVTENRRAARRYPLEVSVRLGEREARTQDLSSKGLYVVTEEGPEVGSVVEMELTLPDASPSGPLQVRLRARVIRIDDLGDRQGLAAEIESWTIPELG